MDLTTDLHIAAGLGALGLGVGAFLRRPGLLRSRIFALLCTAIALWNLGLACNRIFPGDFRWFLIYRLGSCASAPLGLHLTLVLTRRTEGRLKWTLSAAYAATSILYLLAWIPRGDYSETWNLAALVVFGLILAWALLLLVQHMLTLRRGPERGAFLLFLLGAAAAALGGLSDLIPRQTADSPRIGPVAILFFLLIVCALIVRHRFLDLDRFFARSVALLLGAVLAALILFVPVRIYGGSFLVLFLGCLLILALAGPVGRALRAGVRSVAGAADPVAAALVATSRDLPRASTSRQVWALIEEGIRGLPGVQSVALYRRREGESAFSVLDGDTSVDQDGPLPRLLERDRAPVTRRFLEEVRLETGGSASLEAAGALEQMDRLGHAVVIPLAQSEKLIGWVGIRGQGFENALTGEVAAAMQAVGNQAGAEMERIEAMEEARRSEALAAVGEMAAGLAHEIRNPLSAIHGAAQVLEEGGDEETVREMREVIREETRSLGRFVGEFLEYARPLSPRAESVDLQEVARRVLRAAEAAGSGLPAEIEVHEGSPLVRGDPDQLQRVLQNLLQNAREAAGPEGSVIIRIGSGGPGMVRLRFEDDGPGIPPGEEARIFQPFHTTRPGGTGLGLALVHRVVEAHGGEVSVEGRPGRGAAFTLLLPAAEVDS